MNCPNCDRSLDLATYIKDVEKRPKVGDVSVCAYCSEILQFTDVEGELKFERASEEVQIEVAGHPDFIKAMQMAAAMQAWKKLN